MNQPKNTLSHKPLQNETANRDHRVRHVVLVALAFCCAVLAGPNRSNAQADPTKKPKYIATQLKGFGIPFKINAEDDSFIEVQLYVSTNQGKTWRFHSRRPTDETEFPFEAQGDGEYWFALKTLNRNRQLVPEGQPTPELIIIVDTVLPELSFDVRADAAGRIECSWRASDKHLKSDSLQIAYQPIGAAADDWRIVPVNLSGMVRNGHYADQLAWWPETAERSLSVRIAIADEAGNSVSRERRINIAPSPWRHRNESTIRTGDPNANGPVVPVQQVPQTTPPVFPFPAYPDQTTSNQHSQPIRHPADAQPNSNGDYVCENGVCTPRPQTELAANDPEGSSLQRTAGHATHGHQIPVVGSQPEYSDPPHPELYAKVADNRAIPGFAQPSHQRDVTWQSDSERWTPRTQEASATIRSPLPNSENAPTLQSGTNPLHPDLPNPNPNKLTVHRDHVVGESSTADATNQYQGPTDHQPPIAPPDFRTGGPIPQSYQADPSIQSRPVSDPSIRPGQTSEADNWAADDSSAANTPPRPPGLSAAQPMHSAGFSGNSHPSSVITDPMPSDAAVQMIPSKRFRLNYGIDAIDPSGVARVDLWMTRDGGRTWKSWGTDPDNVSPFPVEVEEEGHYGFRIVIHSRDGLTGRGPSQGDQPDLLVVVDTQAPLAQIVSVPYGRAEEAGRLIINYRVADTYLTLRPVSLFYSSNPDGPWTPIEEGLRNEGRYIWKPSANVPDRVFLRLDAIDRAGNRGVHRLDQAIDVSGLVPRGTIHGVVPVGVGGHE